MQTEQDRTTEGLRAAIQMEIDGKEFYLKTSEQSGNELGKKLLRTLAREEDTHRQKFEEIYSSIRERKGWPLTDFKPDGGKGLRTIFARESEKTVSSVKALSSELDAVQKAMAMENKSVDFYESQARKAEFAAERLFYETVASEEREHHMVLLDYQEFLKNPAGWFVRKEHHSLDGG